MNGGKATALVFFGPPGAGKGTQAALFAKRHGLDHVSTGDLFRANLKAETPLGLMAKGFMSRGVLVPDEVVCQMVREHLLETSGDFAGFILDGFPRTVEQARTLHGDLERMKMPLTGVVSFEIPDARLLQRLTGRLTCRACGAIFHRDNRPSRKPGVCDACGGDLYTRPDDTEAAVRERLRVYHRETTPCLDFFRGSGTTVWTVDADRPVDDVTADLEAVLSAR